MLGVIWWLPCWQVVTARSQGSLLGAGASASLLGPGRIFCGMLISNGMFPCVLVQVPLHQPGGTLGDPGLCHTVWAGPLLHLQRLWPMDGQPGVGTWSGRASQILGKGGGRVSFLCSHNNQTKVDQESGVWKEWHAGILCQTETTVQGDNLKKAADPPLALFSPCIRQLCWSCKSLSTWWGDQQGELQCGECSVHPPLQMCGVFTQNGFKGASTAWNCFDEKRGEESSSALASDCGSQWAALCYPT